MMLNAKSHNSLFALGEWNHRNVNAINYFIRANETFHTSYDREQQTNIIYSTLASKIMAKVLFLQSRRKGEKKVINSWIK